MKDEVKLFAAGRSPFVCRVKLALNMKGIKYQNLEEDLNNKSADLLRYNPVHKKVPVLVHNGNPIWESLVIVDYIDDVWKQVPLWPQDPYQKAIARSWAKFIDEKVAYSLRKVYQSNFNHDTEISQHFFLGLKGSFIKHLHDKCLPTKALTALLTLPLNTPSHQNGLLCVPSLYKVFSSNGGEQVVAEAYENLQILENELGVKGNKFFGGDNINMVDIAAGFIAYWLRLLEEATEIKIFSKVKFPKITKWADEFVNCQVVKEILPPKEPCLEHYKDRFGNKGVKVST
ncbi:hypothetical protein OSB04_020599 [Centaurea solstitialis]|uniref:glutathione transferase n=1 Tax=Centaurea solstitialis TaxID=347529 RepID=A0AA38T5Z6_9ASTR|nr:hypothetical protein OSB04_020599 [Centaurea solstitialis]